MKKILFPTDFLETSIHAFIYALKLAENLNGEIITLHVYELPNLNYVDSPKYLSEFYESEEFRNFENYKDEIPILSEIAKKNNLENIKISNIIMEGSFKDNILEIVKMDNIDFVVLGSDGPSEFKESFLGSITGSIMTETNAFVLGIPKSAEYQPIKRICFTTLFTKEDAVAFRKVIEIAKGFNAHIDCVNVKTPHAPNHSVSYQLWKSAFENENVDFHLLESSNIEEAIINFVENQKINMLSMLHIDRNFIGEIFNPSLTKKMANDLNIPLLAIHNN